MFYILHILAQSIYIVFKREYRLYIFSKENKDFLTIIAIQWKILFMKWRTMKRT